MPAHTRHGSPHLHTRQHSFCCTTHRYRNGAPRVHAPMPCAPRHQPPAPHVPQMPSHSHADDTSHTAICAWDPQAPLTSFSSRGSCSPSQTHKGPVFHGDLWPANPPPTLTFPPVHPERSPQCRSLECEGLRGRQWRGDSWAGLGKDVGVCTGESPLSSGL